MGAQDEVERLRQDRWPSLSVRLVLTLTTMPLTPQQPMKPKPFNKLTAAQKRVAIAKDVIDQVEAGKYVPFFGYAMIQGKNEISQKVLKQNPECEVCAVGAAALSAIRLGNHFEFPHAHLVSTHIFKVLSKWFSSEQAGMIEAAYERFSRNGKACFDFEPSIARGSQRIITIFTNIIRNKGEFVP